MANSNCLTTTMSANNKTRVTELNSALAARTMAPRSAKGPSGGGYPNGSVTAISHRRSIDEPVKIKQETSEYKYFKCN